MTRLLATRRESNVGKPTAAVPCLPSNNPRSEIEVMQTQTPTRVGSMQIHGWFKSALCVGALVATSVASHAAITQDVGSNYISWAATNDITINNGTPTTWAIVADPTSSGGLVLEEQGVSDTANVASTAQWSLVFKTAGTYQMYLKYRLQPCCGGNSYRFPDVFGATPNFLVSKANENGSGPASYALLKEQVQNGGAFATFTVAQADVDAATPLIFKIGTREASGLRIDRIVLSTDTALAGIESLPNSGAGFSFTTVPSDLTLDSGQNASFTASVAGGTEPYTYLWYTNGVADTTDGTAATYLRANVTSADNNRTFQLVVKDANLNSITSRVATLTVTPVHFTTDVADQSAPLSQAATFSGAVTSGTVPYTYAWYTNGVLDPSVTTSSYTFSNAALTDSGRNFRLVATDASLISVTSRVATLTVLDRPGMIAASFTGRAGDNVPGPVLTAGMVAGVVPQGYWNNVSNQSVFSGTSQSFQDGNGSATTVTLTYDANDAWNNDGGETTPNDKMMKGISKAARPFHVNTYTFNNLSNQAYDLVSYVNVNGDNRPTDFIADNTPYYGILQHQFGGSFIQITSRNSASRTFGNYVVWTNVVPDSNGRISMKMINGSVDDGAGLAGFQLIPKGQVFTLATQPIDSFGTWQGSTVIFRSAGAFGTGPYTYQWYTNGVADTSPAGQSQNYSVSGVTLARDNSTYYVVATDAALASVTSRTATMTVSAADPARDFGVSFVGRGDGVAGYYILPTDSIGAVARTNWNNNQASGGLESPYTATSPALTNDAGVVTPVTLSYAANDSWNSDGGTATPNDRMMKGIIKDQNGFTGTFTFNNLPPEAAYDVLVYANVNGGGNAVVRYDIWVDNQGDGALGSLSRTNYVRQSGSFPGTFTRAENYNPAGPYPNGTHVLFTNVFANLDGQLFIRHRHISGSDGAGYSGVQLIRRNDITVQPLNMTNPSLAQSPNPVFEGTPATISGPTISSVGPRTYTWQTNTAKDMSGTWVTIAGANRPQLVITPVLADDDTPIRVIVANSYPTVVTSAPITLQVVQDVTSPTLVRALGGAFRNTVKLIFSEAMRVSDATNVANYVVTNSTGATLAVNSISISADGREVTLNTALQGYGETYGVSISGLRDRALSPNTLAPNPTLATFVSYDMDFLPGQVLFRAYPTGGNTAIGELTNHSSFPNSPDYVALIPNMNSRSAGGIYADNSRNNYGGTIAGHFIPPVSGNWIFYVSADDDGQLVMNTNGPSPTGATQMRFAPGCCRALSSGSDPSPVISMIAGQAYYIEGRFKEGGGGDYLEVGARLAGDNSAIVVIPSSQLALGSRLVITAPPSDLTLEEFHSGLFSVGVTATGVGTGFFQWQRSETPGGNTFTNIPGATGSNYLVGPVRIDEDGIVFRVLVTNAVSSTSATSILHVVQDVTKPRLLSAQIDGALRTIFINFSEAMNTNDPALTDPLSYNISLDGNPLILDYTGTNTTSSNVVLNLAPGQLAENTVYTVEIVGFITDAATNEVDPAYISTSFRTPVRSRGLVKYEFYFELGPSQDLNSLLSSPKFPNSPDLVIFTNGLNWGGFPTVSNAPATTTNEYGLRASGYFVPQVSGSHTFWIRNDDSARFSLSTDDRAVNLVLLQNVACCNNTYGAPVTVSDLIAGNSYYFEALLKEGTGGDALVIAVNEPGSSSTNPVSAAYFVAAVDATNAPNAGIAVQPQTVTVQENRIATLSVVVTNTGAYPPFVQWQTNAGSGFGDFPGAVGTTVTTPPMPLAASGIAVRALVYLPGLTLTSTVAQILVNADTNAATAISAASANGTQIGIRFNEPLALANATDTNNFSVDGQLPLSASLRNGSNVVLVVATPVGREFIVNYSNVTDVASTPNAGTNTLLGKYWFDNVVDIGNPTPAGTHFTSRDGELEVNAGGGDVWGTSDQFTYAFTKKTNDFDVKVRVDSIKYIGNAWSKAGINVRESTNANSKMVWFYPTPVEGANAFEGALRVNNGGDVSDLGQPRPAAFFPAWLRLVRSSAGFTPYLSADGTNWTVFGTNAPWSAATFPAELYVGVGTVSHQDGTTTTAKFAELGNTFPTLSFQRLGTNLVIRWDGTGELEYTDDLVPSSWIPIPGATSPYVVPMDQAHRYYRVRRLFPMP
jgi:hypothetical protein